MLLNVEPENWIWFVFCALAGWRLAVLFSYEEGPFNILVHVRRLLVTLGLKRIVGCFHCAALWISIAVVLCVYRVQYSSVLMVLSLAGFISVLHSWTTPPEGALTYDKDQ